MLIVAGALYVHESERENYLAGCRAIIVAARSAPGCMEFHLAADPIDPGRINVFEQWESVGAVERFRANGPAEDQANAIRAASVFQHEIATSTQL